MYKENCLIPPSYLNPQDNNREATAITALRTLLLGDHPYTYELPELGEILSAAMSLASGMRHKVILPLGGTPAEFAFIRSGDRIRIDCYSTESATEVFSLEREVHLKYLLESCIGIAQQMMKAAQETNANQVLQKIVQRAMQSQICPDPHIDLHPVSALGGVIEDPGQHIPLAFGFRVSIVPSVDTLHTVHSYSDIQALLFTGDLWVHSRGRRFNLMHGPIFLAIQRMVAAVRALIDAWQTGKSLNIRLCSEGFSIGVRYTSSGVGSLTLGRLGKEAITIPSLGLEETAFPILRLTSDLTRLLINIDRHQGRNLRISSIRNEVRLLRRMLRASKKLQGFENHDPERLRRTLNEPVKTAVMEPSLLRASNSRLRYTEKWGVEIDGLDATSTFLCGDRFVVANSKRVIALCRDSGELLWSRDSNRATFLLTGRVLIRLMESGEIELCDLDDGSVFARNCLIPRSGGPPLGVFAGGGNAPPVAILTEGHQQLVAIDLLTGQPRWRHQSDRFSSFRIRRAGGVLLLSSTNGTIEALEIASGEVLWRFTDRVRFGFTPCIAQDVVVACSGVPSSHLNVLYGIDIYTGRLLWKNKLEVTAEAEPVEAGNIVILPVQDEHHPLLLGFDAFSGKPLWSCNELGLFNCANLLVDDSLIINSPFGRVTSLKVASGEIYWSRVLSDPMVDDVPRQLDPVLRHGALFVPAARVHVIRPSDGVSLTMEADCDLVPDYLRVDDRGWIYVAEESGHLRAYAPAARLTLVK